MKQFFSHRFWTGITLYICVLLGGLQSTAWAGSWVLDHIEWDSDKHSKSIDWGKVTPTDHKRRASTGDPTPIEEEYPWSTNVSWHGIPQAQDVKTGDGHITLTVTPVFRWEKIGFLDRPADTLIYREFSIASGTKAINQFDGNPLHYSFGTPYVGDYFTIALDNGLGHAVQEHPSTGFGYYRNFSSEGVKIRTVRGGSSIVRGESVTLKGTVKLSDGYKSENFDTNGYGTVSVNYNASPVNFNISANFGSESWITKDKPDEKEYIAYASRSHLGVNDPGSPITVFWGGPASYSTYIAGQPDLGTPTYEWKADPISIRNEGDTETNTGDETNVLTSTPNKSFNHLLHKRTDSAEKSSTTSVKIYGDNPDNAITLDGEVKVNWKVPPSTRYVTNTTFEIIDLDTGSPISLVLDEEEDIDAYIRDIENAESDFFATHVEILEGGAATAQMAAELVVPDPLDIATAGGAKVYKVVKAGRVMGRVLVVVNKIGDKMLAGALRAKGANAKLLVRSRTTTSATGSFGTLQPGATRANEPNPTVIKNLVKGYCFIAGTPVVMADGNLKTIEQIKAGDVVLSRDENTGETAAKKVAQTFERVADATLVLAFSNGERIETTEEHPFYVESRGFVKAGELGIGTSIVTRAGPSLQITAIEKKAQAAKVYNFEVEDFHTYFVGASALWVHNDCVGRKAIVQGHAWSEHRQEFDNVLFEGIEGFTNDPAGIDRMERFLEAVETRAGQDGYSVKRLYDPETMKDRNAYAYFDRSTSTIYFKDLDDIVNNTDNTSFFRPFRPGQPYGSKSLSS